MKKISSGQIISAIIILALLIRLPEMFISLAYDEIWTLLNFAPLDFTRLLFDLELPNNHPLNSILIKLLTYVNLPTEAIRIFSLIAGISSVILCGAIARKKGGNAAMLWSMFFAALTAPLIVYSAQARGYSLQIAFVLLYSYGLISLYTQTHTRYHTNIVMLIAGALGAILSLPTSALFLAAATLILWDHADWKLPGKQVVVPLIMAAVLCLIYLLINIKGLLAARSWGESLHGVSGYFAWLGGTFLMLIPSGFFLQTLWGVYSLRRYWKGITAALLLIFLSALLTNGGPYRVYIILTAAMAIYAGIGMSNIMQTAPQKYQHPLILLAVLIALSGNLYWDMPRWRFTDYSYVCAVLDRQPPEVLIVYPAADTYPVLFATNNLAAEKFASSLKTAPAVRQLLLVNMPGGSIVGADAEFSQQNRALPAGKEEKVANVYAQRYTLEKLAQPWDGNTHVIAIVPQQPTAEATQTLKSEFQRRVIGKKVLLLNLWFTGARLSSGAVCDGAVYYLEPGAVSSQFQSELLTAFGDKISFYRIIFPRQAQ